MFYYVTGPYNLIMSETDIIDKCIIKDGIISLDEYSVEARICKGHEESAEEIYLCSGNLPLICDVCRYSASCNNRSLQYDSDGYNKNGYDSRGYDRSGFNEEGYDSQGYDESGIDKLGWSRKDYSPSEYLTKEEMLSIK